MERVFVLKNVRVFYKKKDRLKFISHLDMTRFMARIIKKSGIPVWYTEGFNKHIYMNFALPLSLGFESVYEIMDFRLSDDSYPLNETLKNLINAAPEGMEFFSISEPQTNFKSIGYADFELCFEEENAELFAKLEEFLSLPQFVCKKKGKKGKIKEIEIMSKIKAFSLKDKTLFLRLIAGTEDNLNPTLVLTEFFEWANLEPLYYTVLRTSIRDKSEKEFC